MGYDPEIITTIIISALSSSAIALFSVFASYNRMQAKVLFLEKQIEEMKSKSTDRQTFIYEKFDKIEEDIKEISVQLARLNGKH